MARTATRPATRPRLVLLVAIVLALSVVPTTGATALSPPAGALASEMAPVAPLPQLTRVRLGEVGILASVGFYVGIEKGYFAEQGIDVETVRFNTTAEMTAPLAAGQLDAGSGATSAGLFNAIGRGVDIKMVADQGHSEPGRPVNAFVVRRAGVDAGQLRSVADLRGRHVAVTSISTGAVTDVQAYLAQGGLTVNDVVIEQMSFPDMIPSLANGSVDAVIPVEPFTTLFEQSGVGTRWFWDYDVNPDHQVAVILYGPTLTRDQPEVARRWMVAYLRGLRYFNDGFFRGNAAAREDSIQILMKWTTIRDRALYDTMTVLGLDPNGDIRVASMRADQEALLQLGQQDRPIDLDAAVDMQYVRYAREVLGPY
jgi:NitT/TauT family transport system substrate-binding protein